MSKDNSPFILNSSDHDLVFNLFNRKHHKVNSHCLKGDNYILKEFQIPTNIIANRPIESCCGYQKDKLDEASLHQLKSTKTDVKSNDNSGNTNDSNSSPKSQEDKNIQEEVKIQEEPPKIYKYYLSSTPKSLIQIEGTIGTDDYDLNHFMTIMNEEPIKEKGYKSVINEPNTQIYKKLVPGCDVILIKSYCKIPYSKDVIFEAIADINIRKAWDSVFSELTIVGNDGENGSEVLYLSLKSPSVFVTDRDFVQQRKIWKNFPTKKSHMLHFKSIEHPKCPRKKKYVRAETIISGYYIQDAENGNGSILGIISQTDVKGSIPIFLVNKVAPKASKGWVQSLLKGCKMVQDKKY